ncbi:MAG TPA: hypothetical protein VK841_10715 [Polyangiaceae bacterium]|nr:hypothetical protein [Polyangiaceae bacterium]
MANRHGTVVLRLRCAGFLAILLVAFGHSRIARAQNSNEATARALFAEGQQLAQSGQTEAACAKFEAASHLFESPGLLVNLGDCYEKLGRTASASATFAHAAAVGGAMNRPNETAEANRRQSALAPRLVRMVIRVPREVPGLKVTRDGIDVPQGAWTQPVAIDPGTHVVRAEADGYAPWSTSVAVSEEGRTASVDVPELSPLAVAAPAPPLAAPSAAPAATSPPDVVWRPRKAAPPSAKSAEPEIPRNEGDPRHQVGWIDASIGPGYSTLASLNSNDLSVQNTSGGGVVAGFGAGLRLSFLSVGARARLLGLNNVNVWEIDGETAFHVQIDTADLYLGLRGGYAVGSIPNGGANGGSGDVDGFNVGSMIGFDSFITSFLAWGIEINPELLDVSRPPLPLPAGLSPSNLTPAQQSLYRESGLNIGLVFIASVHLGLHF